MFNETNQNVTINDKKLPKQRYFHELVVSEKITKYIDISVLKEIEIRNCTNLKRALINIWFYGGYECIQIEFEGSEVSKAQKIYDDIKIKLSKVQKALNKGE